MSAYKTEGYAHFGYSVRLLVVLLVIVGLTLFASNIAADLFSFTSIESLGSVKSDLNLGVYWDGNCNSACERIDWGDIEPGSVKNVSLFIRNEGTVPASLSLSTDKWSPSNASEFITLTWDYSGQTLDRFEIVLVTLTLHVSPGVAGIKSFIFDIIIGATA